MTSKKPMVVFFTLVGLTTGCEKTPPVSAPSPTAVQQPHQQSLPRLIGALNEIKEGCEAHARDAKNENVRLPGKRKNQIEGKRLYGKSQVSVNKYITTLRSSLGRRLTDEENRELGNDFVKAKNAVESFLNWETARVGFQVAEKPSDSGEKPVTASLPAVGAIVSVLADVNSMVIDWLKYFDGLEETKQKQFERELERLRRDLDRQMLRPWDEL